jgi:hypothetical protein
MPEDHLPSTLPISFSPTSLKVGIIALIGMMACFYLLVNLEGYPTINGWDEGLYLDFAMNLAYSGEYATQNGHVFERLIPCGGTGPTLIVPIALALRLSNNSLLAARLVMVIFFAIALIAGYCLLRTTESWTAAAISVPLLLVAGYQGYDALWVGRQVLAELPALAFLLLGIWAWMRGCRGSWWWLIGGALSLGLSVVTKNQLMWVLVGASGMIILADLIYFRQLNWAQRLIPPAGVILGYGLWFAGSLLILGPDQQATYLECQQALGLATFFRISPSRWFENAKYFLRSDQWLLALIAIGYTLWRSRFRTLDGLHRLMLPVLTGLSLLASFLALPWPRYLFFPLALAALCTAIVIQDVTGWAQNRWKLRNLRAGVLALVLVAFLVGPRLAQNAQRILTGDDNSASVFAARIDQTVPPGEPVLNWEWEIEFFTARNFIHPSYFLFPAMVDSVYNEVYDSLLDAPRIPPDVEYVIVGPFAQTVQAFTEELAEQEHEVIIQEGPYQLYRLILG